MLKGVLEGCILAIIERDTVYGYEISQKLEKLGFGVISEGTIYPILLRLEKNNQVVSKLRESPNGPRRKYYFLTDIGKEKVKEFEIGWEEVSRAVKNLFGGE